MMFKLSEVFLVVVLLIGFVFAQVDLTGKVVDKKNGPEEGVIVKLSGAGISDTTDINGVYHLTDGIGIKNPQVKNHQFKIQGNQILFSVTGKQDVFIYIYDSRGREIADIPVDKWSKYWTRSISRFASQVLFIRLQVDGTTVVRKFINMKEYKSLVFKRIENNSTDVTLAVSLQTVEDTLSFVKNGQIITIQEIFDLTDTLDIFIVQRNIGGSLLAIVDSISKIEAVLTGDIIPDSLPKLVKLGRVGISNYSGFVYFIYLSDTSDIINYNVFVKVYDDSARFIGRSEDVSFNSDAGDIIIPDFNVNSAKPWVSLGNDTTVSIYDTIYLTAIVVDPYRQLRDIAKYEWNIDGSGFVEGSGDTAIAVSVFKRLEDITPKIKVTDIDNNTASDSIIITIVQDIPIPTISTTTPIVSINDSIHFQGVAINEYGSIVKWEWDIGNTGIFIETLDSIYSTVALSVANSQFECVLKVTDDDTNVVFDTVNINVLLDLPISKASIAATGLIWMGDQLQLNGAGTDEYGEIVKWEWDTGGAFVEAPDTNLTIIVSGYGLHKYVLRVTDDDGNIVVDTVVANCYGMNGKMSLIHAKGVLFEIGTNSTSSEVDVELTYDFWMDTTEVTQADYEILMGVDSSYFDDPNNPVETVTWFDAVLYCNARSKADLLDTVYVYTAIEGEPGDSTYGLTDLSYNILDSGYRLPTEAEWEYACRGDAYGNSLYFWGDNESDSLINYAWCIRNSGDSTHTVGTKQPNNYRLYDMIGNVLEWINNWYEEDYIEGVDDGINPIGPLSSGYSTKGARGAYYDSPINHSYKTAYRDKESGWSTAPGIRNKTIGFRTVRTVE